MYVCMLPQYNYRNVHVNVAYDNSDNKRRCDDDDDDDDDDLVSVSAVPCKTGMNKTSVGEAAAE